ncbi:DUF4972 domain-containing protein [Proteiniphilum sp. UBA5384]|uniref:DUF4972 domain-containing protein n=1 Tax=Proteiniphilum sp. UBA5384 TaxID=1947279 RepID=UPI0025DBEC73|nr:DUF4972 domain-containing protein [Proteiniphilum sp. UBA5384]
MNTVYSIWKMGRYTLLCVVLMLQFIACSEEKHDEYTAAPEIEDVYIHQLDELIAEMQDLQQNSDYGEKKGQYPTESRAILSDAIDAANRAVLLIKYQNPAPSENEKQRYIINTEAAMEKFRNSVRTEDAETIPAELFVDGKGGNSFIDFGRSEEYVKFGEQGKQAFTVELWVKITERGRWDNCLFLCSYISNDDWRNGWMMYWRKSDNGIYRTTWGGLNTTNGDRDLWEPSFRVSDDLDQWQHFVAVYSDEGLGGNSTLRAKLYLNGEWMKDEIVSPVTRVYQSAHYAEYSKPMTAFGRYMRTTDDLFEEGFSGYMKKIRIWKTAKSADYIKKSYEGAVEVTGKETDLAAGWDFTSKPSGADNEIIDLTGRHTAKIIGTYKWERIVE